MIVVPTTIKLEMSVEVFKEIKAVNGIKTLIVLALASFYLAIMYWCVRANQFMLDTMLFQMYLKEGELVFV